VVYSLHVACTDVLVISFYGFLKRIYIFHPHSVEPGYPTDWTIRDLNPGGIKSFVSSPKRPDRQYQWILEFFPEVKAAGA
jgi:hypothetical protein